MLKQKKNKILRLKCHWKKITILRLNYQRFLHEHTMCMHIDTVPTGCKKADHCRRKQNRSEQNDACSGFAETFKNFRYI